MTKSLNDKLLSLSKRRQAVIKTRTDQLIAEQMTVRDLRTALKKTQTDLGQALEMTQDGVSRLERRSDMLLSTLKKYISALGGTLTITADFPGRPTVTINNVLDLEDNK